mmetsp:Transcript_58938/g.133443  ORF Transcript_58938/g.133443 Transcript_58938/m.133443 type:complete len:212 (-) Transcript_58938:415-1050(-)
MVASSRRLWFMLATLIWPALSFSTFQQGHVRHFSFSRFGYVRLHGSTPDGDQERRFILRRKGSFGFGQTRLRATPDRFLDVYVDEGSRLTKLGDDGLFTLVRTEQGEVGLVRSVHLETWTEDSWKPGYLLALEEMQERSAERRRKAVEGREELGALVDALRPLEALFGGGSLIDPQGSITSRGWAAVAIAIYVPVNAAVYLSNSLRSLTTR